MTADVAIQPEMRGAFLEVFQRVAATVVVVTCRDAEGASLGMTATSVCSLSVEPLSVVACVNRTTRTYAHIAENGRFGLSFLNSGQQEIADHCSRPGSSKVLPREWQDHGSSSHSPMVRHAVAHLDCRVADEHPGATHVILIGHVDQVFLGDVVEPLLYCRRAYKSFAPDEAVAMSEMWDRLTQGFGG